MLSASLCSRQPILFPNRQDLPAAGSELARVGLGLVHGLSGTRQTLGLREMQTPGAELAEEPEPEQDPQTKPQNRGTHSRGEHLSVQPPSPAATVHLSSAPVTLLPLQYFSLEGSSLVMENVYLLPKGKKEVAKPTSALWFLE